MSALSQERFPASQSKVGHWLEELGERLDRKAFESARLYYKMEDYRASRVAFKNILKDDADNVYREEILYYSAMSSYKYADLSVPSKQKERFLIFMDDYLNFVGEYPQSEHRKELDPLYAKVKEKIETPAHAASVK
jgi:outer membrane protein assembly factor BamD